MVGVERLRVIIRRLQDIEGIAGGARQRGAGSRQRIASANSVDREVGESRHAATRGLRQGAVQGAVAGARTLVTNGHSDRRRTVCHDVVARVFDLHCYSGSYRSAYSRVRRLLEEYQLRSRSEDGQYGRGGAPGRADVACGWISRGVNVSSRSTCRHADGERATAPG